MDGTEFAAASHHHIIRGMYTETEEIGIRCGSLELQINLNVGTTTLHKLEHNANPIVNQAIFLYTEGRRTVVGRFV